MVIVEYYKLGEIDGYTTDGSNGNINRFTVSTAYGFIGLACTSRNKMTPNHHLSGIKPTV